MNVGPVQIAIDPGHGGRDPGAVNNNNTPITTDDTLEKDLNLSSALTLKHYLNQRGIGVFLTRSTDVTLPNSQRAPSSEAAGARLLVSIHHDVPWATRPGCYHNDDPAAPALARQVAQALQENAWVRPHTDSRFGRLWIADFNGPAILLEFGATAPYGREERIRRCSLALVPILAYLRGDTANV